MNSSDVKTTPDQAELWQVYLKGMQKLAQLWAESLEQSLKSAGKTTVGEQAAFLELTELYWNIYERTFGSFLQSPNFGYSREFNNKLQKGFDAWIQLTKATFDYQGVLVEVWMKAFEELMRELGSSEEKGKTVQNWQELLQVWSRAFDRVFAQKFGSEDAVALQGKFLSAAMTYKFQQQQLTEVFLKMYDLPTRSEVDEIHRNIYELRKEIKSLNKALGESQAKVE
ncbi:MAG: class III poly(R)-hydroxyalkanoic acid synthase subunit PhaE [Microcoleus vaginatus WJT46-NPBG5]|jgi:class III poly(R)-hydroxyalkanoic acid synthase PhaE subunit|nr:class III poly(R)-hydroxyalkanoic acid synthase subunit PhaE [Microcoleus vaginatus WJT46-NPBG5]